MRGERAARPHRWGHDRSLLVLLGAALAVLAACVVPGSRAGPSISTRAQQAPLAQSAVPAATQPTVTPTPEPTAVPTPTATPHPLSIAALRGREYPGSDIVIEQTLAPGVNYNQYVVSYRSDGLKIYALLTVPRGQRPATGWPAIVFNHGYIPPQQYRTTERYVAYVDAFARSGYVVIKPDYRGHGSSEGEARGGYGSSDYVVDVLNALASLRRWPDVDPNRIGMWGHSMGGFVTLRAMVVDRGIKAGVIWAGVVASYPDLIARWGSTSAAAGPRAAQPPPGRPPSWRSQLVTEYGTPDQNPAFWASLSANSYLADLPGPLQLHHGTGDHEVPLWMSETLLEQVRAAGGSAELYTYPGDDHNISHNLYTALARSVAFFDTYVKGS